MLYAAEVFSGAGLLSLGLSVEGIHVGETCEIDRAAVQTLNFNFGHPVVSCDARGWTPGSPPNGIDILCGGPPCQPWSGAGAQRGYEDKRDMFPQIVRWAREVRPRLILMENVGITPESRKRSHASLSAGILSPQFADYINWWWSQMNDAGYEGVIWSLLAADYGTPQLRARVVFVAWPHGSPLKHTLSTPPPITHAHPDDFQRLGLLPWTAGHWRLTQGCCARVGLYSCAFLWNSDGLCETCGQGSNYEMADDDFIDTELAARSLAYVMRDPQRIHKHPPADMSGTYSRWLAPTMVADLARGVPYGLVVEPGGLVGDFTDPRDYDFLRRLTPREAAKLMDVPQWFIFKGTVPQRYRQIGNGVPVNMGRAIARHVLRAFGEPVKPARRPQSGLWPLEGENPC